MENIKLKAQPSRNVNDLFLKYNDELAKEYEKANTKQFDDFSKNTNHRWHHWMYNYGPIGIDRFKAIKDGIKAVIEALCVPTHTSFLHWVHNDCFRTSQEHYEHLFS